MSAMGSFVVAFLSLCIADIVLKLGKIAGIRRLVRGIPTKRILSRTANVDHIIRIFNVAALSYVRSVMCIQRSAALTCLLRLHGIPASFIIGCRTMPFLAHAWVEVEGQPINENRLRSLEVLDTF